jgi:hypothetical protein
MKIIKKIALCALFANVAYSADLPELPEDHPIKTAVQMAKLVFLQYPIPISQIHHGTGCHTAKLGIDNNLLLIQKTATDNFKVCVDTLFSNEDISNVFLVNSQIQSTLSREHTLYFGTPRINIIIGPTLDSITSEIDTYIHQSFENNFSLRMDDKKFASAYNLALVYRDANTAHLENTAKANRWIAEIQAKATAEVEQIGNVVYALLLERTLQTTERTRATRIIDSFEKVDAVFHERLNTCFYAIVNQETPIVPFAAEQLLLARKLQDMVFRIDDEDDA